MNEEVSQMALVRPEDLSAAEKRERLIQLVIDSVASPHSRRAYRSGLEQFFRWWQETAAQEPFGRALVQSYRSHLEVRGCAPATINRQLAPIRKRRHSQVCYRQRWRAKSSA